MQDPHIGFIHQDGTEPEFNDFATGEPSSEETFLTYRGKWGGAPKESTNKYVCKKNAPITAD